MRRWVCRTRSWSTPTLMFDLLAVAYQSDLTRVFSFMMSREASQRTYPELNIPGTHHDVSHHGGRPENMENHAKINLHYAQLFARFVEKLKAMPEGDGTVLDNSLIFYGAGMSDGQAHAPYPLPLVAVGSAGGKVKGDRHIVAPEWTPVANLWLRISDLYGARLDIVRRKHRSRRDLSPSLTVSILNYVTPRHRPELGAVAIVAALVLCGFVDAPTVPTGRHG